MELRDLAGDRDGPVRPAGRREIRERRGHPTRGFVEHLDPLVRCDDGEPGRTLAALAGQEALEREPVGDEAGEHDRREDRARARHDLDRNPGLDTGGDEARAGIAHAGGAGVADVRDASSGEHPLDEVGGPIGLVVGVHRDETARARDARVREEATGAPGVLARDDVDRRERLDRAR